MKMIRLFPILLIAFTLAITTARGQMFDFNVTGTFDSTAPATQFSGPNLDFSLNFTMSGDVTYESSGYFIVPVSAVSFSLNGGPPLLLQDAGTVIGDEDLQLGTSTLLTYSDLPSGQMGIDLRLSLSGQMLPLTGALDPKPVIPGTYPGAFPFTDVAYVTSTGEDFLTAPISSDQVVITPVPEPTPLALAATTALLVSACLSFRRGRSLAMRAIFQD